MTASVQLKLPFSLKSHVIESLKNFQSKKRILLRICNMKVKKSSQNDRISRKLQIKINKRVINLGVSIIQK